METKLWLALKEDINRIIPIIARRNNCMDNDVINVMDACVHDYNERIDSMQFSLQGSYKC